MMADPQPPKWADKLLEGYCRNGLLDSIQGDLHEQFALDVHKYGLHRARRRYWINVLTFPSRFTMRSSTHQQIRKNRSTMIRSYALITFRTFQRKPVFAFINITGLAVGLTACLLIFFYVQHELSFDNFHEKGERIYRVANTFDRANSSSHWVRTPPALAPAIRDNFPGVTVTRLRYEGENVVSLGNRSFNVAHCLYADSLFLQIFDFELLQGDRESALNEPNSVLISQTVARKFFGDTNPVGATLRFDNQKDLKVTGVLKDVPSNSHLQFDFLMSFSTYVVPDGYLADLTSWGWGGFYTYLLLEPGADVNTMESSITDLLARNYTRGDTKVGAPLQQLGELYFGFTDFTNRGEAVIVGSRSTIYALTAIAVLVLLIASFNFMNLSTAMSISRGKEIGMRKVLGAPKRMIRQQFLVESVIFALLSLVLAAGVFSLVGPYVTGLLGVALPASLTTYLGVVPMFILFTVLVGLLSGTYPAFILSAFSPIESIKGKLSTPQSGGIVRKGLVALQFVISIGLIIVSLLIVRQSEFMRNRPLGYDRENILSVNLFLEDMRGGYTELKNELLQNTAIASVCRSSHAFEGGSSSGPALVIGAPEDESIQMTYYQTGYDFLDVMDIELLAGRYFSKAFPNDTAEALVLNETAVRQFGFDEPLGQRIRFNNRDRRVIGVVRDFHISSLHTPIRPMGIVMPFAELRTVLIRTEAGRQIQALDVLQEKWEAGFSKSPFEVTFLDDTINALYAQEARLSKLVSVFALLAVVLACLGIYGLITFSIRVRLKEVGIRKVLGAPVSNLLFILSNEFLWLMIIASIIAWPIAYRIGEQWLEGFSYRLSMDPWMFLSASLVLIVLVVVTMSHQVVKAALANPTKVLRSE